MTRTSTPPPRPDSGPDGAPLDLREGTRRTLRTVLIAMLFGSGWAALISGAPWIRFSEDMGLKQHRFAWGLLAAIPFLGSFLQLLGSYLVERTGRRRPLFFAGFLTQRLVWVALAVTPFLLTRSRLGAIVAVLVLFLINHSAAAIAMPSWTSWMADAIPARIRGRYFGVRARLGPLVVIPTALAAGWLLEAARQGSIALPRPEGLLTWRLARLDFSFTALQLCSVFFVVGAALGVLDILMFRRVPEPPVRRQNRSPRLREIFGPPLRDRRFRQFLLFYSAFYIAVPGIGYYVWLYIMNEVNVGPLWAQAIFMGGGGLGAVLFAGLWGRLIDRFGCKTVWLIAYVVPVLLPVMYGAIQPSFWVLAFLVTFTDGVFWNAVEQTNFNALLKFSARQEGTSSGYQAIHALAMAVTGTLSGLLFAGLTWLVNHLALLGADEARAAAVREHGWRTDLWGFQFSYLHVLFVVATAIRVVAYLTLLPGMDDKGRVPVREAVGYLFARTYNGLLTLATFPWRTLGRAATQEHVDPENGRAR